MSSPLPQPSSSSSSIPINTKPRSPSVSSRRSSRSIQASGLKPWGTLSRKSAQSSSLSLVVAKGDMDPSTLPSAKERLPSVRRVTSVDVKPEVESVAEVEHVAAPLEPTPEPEPAAPAVVEPAPIPEPTPKTSAISPTPTPTPVAPQPTRSWFNTRSTLSTSPPQDTDNAQETQIIANGIKAATEEPMTPGVDDVVPPLRLSAPESSQQHQQQPSKSASASSLGMLSSRYSLALPLLGRAKVPLDAAMRDASKDEEEAKLDVHAAAVYEGYLPPQEQRPVLAPTSTTTAPAALPVPASASPAQRAADTVSGSSTPLTTATPPSEPELKTTPAPAAEDLPAPRTDDKLKPEDTLPARSSSWWDLVWTPAPSAASMPASSSADAANANPSAADEPTPAVDATSKPADTDTSPTDPTPRQVKDLVISPPPPPPPTISPQQPDAPQQELPEPPHTARSVQSATSGATGASAWYTPWTWYGAAGVGGAGSAPVITVGGEEPAKDGAEDGVKEGEALTAAEEIKREALARDACLPTPTPSPSNPNPPPPTLEERSASAPPPSTSPIPSFTTNPIEKSLTANLGGWSTFFTSRALGAKRVKDEEERKEEGEGEGMEVVDVPDDVGAGVEVRLVASSGGEGAEKTVNEGEREKEDAPKDQPTSDPLKQDPARDKSLTRTGRDRATSKSSATSSKSKAPTPSRSGANSPNPRPGQPPNLVLPLFAETFGSPPRSLPLAEEQRKSKGKAGGPVRERAPSGSGTLAKAGRLLGSYWRQTGGSTLKGKGKARESSSPAERPVESVEVRGEREREEERAVEELARRLPRTWSVAEGGGVSVSELAVGSGVGVVGGDVGEKDVLRGAKRAVVIGIHGWFPGTLIKSLAGEPTGTSAKFASMAGAALEGFAERHGVTWEKVTNCPLEGEGRIGERVQRLYDSLTSNEEWMSDLKQADVIFVACHSQGSIVSTHLLDRLLSDGHIHTSSSSPVSAAEDAIKTLAEGNVPHKRKIQKVVCLALCGIHLGPLRYLGSSSLLQPYFQYLEGAAARELFEFQNTESAVSKEYVSALGRVLAAEVKMVYVASLNDQVVPIYSGIFTAASHPLILRALYIDGDAYHSTDFLTNLLVLLTRILNAGLPDSGLALHLSEATAGSLSGIGHSTAYEEAGVYDLAVDYLFLTNSGSPTTLPHPPLHVESFSATSEQNDYEIPWRLRDLIAHPLVARLFGPAFADLRDAFPHWHPRTAILRDVKRKLSPIQRLREGRGGGAFGMGSVGVGGVSRL
ncbi:hypothetical protein PENSPDRAFT_686408 [Peniophora sp. CONT]|nr:hypothetical protein PENSPDRAFT_686408 [Peniophora sp. CONT]